MNQQTHSFQFPEAEVVEEHQTGASRPLCRGVEVRLFSKEGASPGSPPDFALLVSPGGADMAEIGLEWEGRELSGYDGTFFLPGVVADALVQAGFTVNKEDFCS